MKKMYKLFSMLLALAMLLSSTIAMAEETESLSLYSINLSDLTMSIDDEMLLDLSGLTVSLGAGVSDTGSEGLISASVLGGEEAAITANAALADGKIAVNMDGMSKPLTLDLASLLTEENIQLFIDALLAEFTEQELAALEQIYTASLALVSEENLSLMEQGYITYMEEVDALVTENMTTQEGVPNSFVVGPDEEISSSQISMVFEGEDIIALMNSVAKFYDSNPAIVDLINGFLMLDDEAVQITSYSDLLDMEEMQEMYSSLKLHLDIYVSDDYDNGYIDMVFSLYDTSSGADEKLCDVVTGIGVTDSIRAVILIADTDDNTVYADFSMVPSETTAGAMETSFYMSATEDGTEEQLMNLWIGPDPDFGTLGVLTIGDEGDSVGMAVGYSDSAVVFSLYDDYGTSFEIGYTTNYEGAAAGEGTLYFNAVEGETVANISAIVSTTVTEVPLADVQSMVSVEGIDMTNISEEDSEALTSELQLIMLNAVNTLEQNVPGIANLMGDMIE